MTNEVFHMFFVIDNESFDLSSFGCQCLTSVFVAMKQDEDQTSAYFNLAFSTVVQGTSCANKELGEYAVRLFLSQTVCVKEFSLCRGHCLGVILCPCVHATTSKARRETKERKREKRGDRRQKKCDTKTDRRQRRREEGRGKDIAS